MRIKKYVLTVLVFFFTGTLLGSTAYSTDAAALSNKQIKKLGLDSDTNRLVCVTADGGTTATVTMYRLKKNGKWKKIMKTTKGYVGYGGVGQASEYRNATPEGLYHFTKLFGVRENPGTKCRYTKLRSTHFWVDDVNSKYYNRFVDTEKVTKDWTSAENLSAVTDAYAYVAAFDYNKSCTPGKGSAFFLHCTQWHPTQGCISVPEENMRFILKHLTKHAQIYITNA